MIRFIRWFFSNTKKPIVEEHDVYEKLLELQERVVRLEEENIETSNVLYELYNSLDAVDARIDILTAEKFLKDDDV